MKILILAEQCNPEWPSLPIVGYKAAKAIADIVQCTIVTHIRNKENIDKAGLSEVEIIYIDNEYIAKPIYNLSKLIRGNEGGWTTAMAFNYPAYLAFEWEAWKQLKGRINSGEFDVIHRVTPMSPTLPSIIATKTKVPFVLGPLNGGLKWPEYFNNERGKEREWLFPFRNIYKLLPYRRATLKRVAVILAGFQHTIDDLPHDLQPKIINFPEVGIDPDLFNQKSDKEYKTKKTVLFASRLVPYKLPDVVIDAFISSAILQKHELIIVGDGPLRAEMELKVHNNNLQHVIKFVGWKTQLEVSQYMQDSDIFAYPTIRELGAGALVEAMACKLVPVVVDYGASSELVDYDRGIKLKLANKNEITKQMIIELESLVVDTQRLSTLSNNAHNHVMKYYDWHAKANKSIKIYNWILNKESKKPNFWS